MSVPFVTEPDNLVPWQFVSHPDDTKLNLQVSVVGPDVADSLDGSQGGGVWWYPLCPGDAGNYPMLSTRDIARKTQIKHKWWFSGNADYAPGMTPDFLIDAIRRAKEDATIDYFIYNAMDTTTAKVYYVLFDPDAAFERRYLWEHRYLDVTLMVVGEPPPP
jgi:hypothetical protein